MHHLDINRSHKYHTLSFTAEFHNLISNMDAILAWYRSYQNLRNVWQCRRCENVLVILTNIIKVCLTIKTLQWFTWFFPIWEYSAILYEIANTYIKHWGGHNNRHYQQKHDVIRCALDNMFIRQFEIHEVLSASVPSWLDRNPDHFSNE